MVTEHVSVKLEYLYADLGTEHYGGRASTSGPFAPPGLGVEGNGDFERDIHTLKAGLNYRF